MASPDGEGAISQIALMRTRKSIETMLVFIPDSPEMSWKGGSVDISFTPDKLRFSWDSGGLTKTYIPYSIRFTAVEGSKEE
ncbi:hypothetical protein SDC9_182277 [bioreactor metagenome]|uniref:Uncharacterized protein n=1 Tax=bioreactor metagenome TaxID=1076179 RepID=A0A645HGI0_9ZZZZ